MFEEDIDTDYYNSDLESDCQDDESSAVEEEVQDISDSEPLPAPASAPGAGEPAPDPTPASAPGAPDPTAASAPGAGDSHPSDADEEMDYFDRLALSELVPTPPARGACMCV